MSACVGLPLLSPKSSSTRNDSAGAPPSSAAPAKRKGSHGSNISSSIQIVNGALRHVLPPAKRQRGSRGDAVAIDVQQLALSSRDTDNGCPATATSPSKQTLVGEVASTSTRNSPRPSPARAKTRYFCQHPGCDKSYTKPVRLAEHERSHTGERPFGCPEEGCSASYLRETHLAAHLRTHRDESEKPLLCSEDGCDKRFWTNQHLKRHVRLVHEQDKDQYRCPQCPAAFNKHHKLRSHVASEHMPEGTNPFICPQEGCNKSFKTGSKLRSHAKVHDESRYICMHPSHLVPSSDSDEPGQAPRFPTWSALLAHNKAAHPSACVHPDCDGKVFKNAKALKKHTITKHLQTLDALVDTVEHEGGVTGEEAWLREGVTGEDEDGVDFEEVDITSQ